MHATVIGAQGYLGRELMRLLAGHPAFEQVTPVSRSLAGTPFSDVVPGFAGTHYTFSAPGDNTSLDADAVFLSAPAGVAAGLAQAHLDAGAKLVVDLSRDHRIGALAGTNGWTYGAPDVFPIQPGTQKIANPGCYPTAAMLALAPALQANLIGPGPIIVDGKSGVSGAGVTPRADLHYPEMNESVRAYKVLGHDHAEEIAATTGLLNGATHPIRFTPHLVPQTRGLLVTAYAPTAASAEQVAQAYQDAYAESATVHVTSEADTGAVRGSQHAQVAVDVDPDTGLLIARGAIDNLRRGGAGTAIQNANQALGLPSHQALEAVGGNC